uniref:Proline--tRNA ligase 2 n=1 Tax=Lygus hesperus TaxID=30085 RepID=A0A0A9X045_LYGHE
MKRSSKNSTTAVAAVAAVSNMNTIPITLRTLSSTTASSLYPRNLSSQQLMLKQQLGSDVPQSVPIGLTKTSNDVYDSIIPGINDDIPNFFSGRTGTNLQGTFHDSMQQRIGQQDLHHDVLRIGIDTNASVLYSGTLQASNFMNNAAGTYNTIDTMSSSTTQEIIPS